MTYVNVSYWAMSLPQSFASRQQEVGRLESGRRGRGRGGGGGGAKTDGSCRGVGETRPKEKLEDRRLK